MSATLVIDTSAGTEVAVVVDGTTRAHQRRDDPRGHAEHLAPMIQAAVREANAGALDEVVVGTGPAPFTGLRVGLVTALAFGRARAIPVLGVGSLQAWAASAFAARTDVDVVRVVTDARRREVYTASYRRSEAAERVEERGEPTVLAPAALAPTIAAEREQPGYGVVGPDLWAETLGPVMAVERDVATLAGIALAQRARGEALPTTPQYLRRPDVHGVPGGAA